MPKSQTASAVAPAIYKVIIHPASEGGYWAECSMPNGGCTTDGNTLQETQKNMFEAMDLYLEDYPEVAEYFLNFEYRHA